MQASPLPRPAPVMPPFRAGDGPDLCRRSRRIFGRPGPGGRHGPEDIDLRIPPGLRLKGGPDVRARQRGGFAARRPVTIRRPRTRGHRAALGISKEALQ